LKQLYTFIISLFCLTTAATAQVTLSAPNVNVALNATFTVELRATTRDSLTSLQFSFAWNPAVLAFQRVDTVGGFPPSAISDEFGLSNTAGGKLTSLWIDGSSRGYRVPTDSFIVFKIVFKAIGANGTSSALQFVAAPTTIKASNANLVTIPVTLREGLVRVGTTAIFTSNTEGVTLGQNYPNPFATQTIIPVTLQEMDDVTLEITDLIGKKILIKKYHFEAGRHEIRLTNMDVISNGIFIYNLKTKRGLASHAFIKR
jgi:hypothetical protein